MKKITITAAILAAGFLGACTDVPMEPAVSEYNGDSVRIQIPYSGLVLSTEEARGLSIQKADGQANEICRRGHKKGAIYMSQRTVQTSQYGGHTERFYLCLN